MRRSALERGQVEAILEVQASREERLAHADDVLDNAGSPESLPDRITALHQRYCQLGSQAGASIAQDSTMANNSTDLGQQA
jgi:dephospho-CoA kinase